MTHKISLKALVILIIFFVLLFNDFLSNYFVYFSYVDELLAVLSIIIICFFKKEKDVKLVFFLVILCIIGLISNLTSRLINNLFVVLVDLIGVTKIFFVYIAFSKIISKNTCEQCIDIINSLSKIFVLIALFFLALNTFGIVDMYDAYRYGFREYRFIFINAGTFGYYLMTILPFFINKKHEKFFVFLTLMLIMSTFKGPQLIFVIIFLYLYITRRMDYALKSIFMLIGVLFIAVLSSYQITNYFLDTTSGRYLLIKNGFITADTYFPLGSGFATYGSEMSRRFYSLLYYKYGFDRIWGMNLEYSGYINDNYWPMLIAQLGYLGLIIIIIIYFIFLKNIWNKTKRTRYSKWGLALFVAYLVGSLGSAYLTSSIGVITILSICIIQNNEVEIDGQTN